MTDAVILQFGHFFVGVTFRVARKVTDLSAHFYVNDTRQWIQCDRRRAAAFDKSFSTTLEAVGKVRMAVAGGSCVAHACGDAGRG